MSDPLVPESTPGHLSFHSNVEACVFGYVQNWAPAAGRFANDFATRRLFIPRIVSGDSVSIDGLKLAYAQFVEELHATVTSLELAALIANLRVLHATHHRGPLDDADASLVKEIMFPMIADLELTDNSGSGMLGGIAKGAMVGAYAGAPFAGFGALPGAVAGGIAGMFFGHKVAQKAWAQKTRAQMIDAIPAAVRYLQTMVPEAVRLVVGQAVQAG